MHCTHTWTQIVGSDSYYNLPFALRRIDCLGSVFFYHFISWLTFMLSSGHLCAQWLKINQILILTGKWKPLKWNYSLIEKYWPHCHFLDVYNCSNWRYEDLQDQPFKLIIGFFQSLDGSRVLTLCSVNSLCWFACFSYPGKRCLHSEDQTWNQVIRWHCMKITRCLQVLSA